MAHLAWSSVRRALPGVALIAIVGVAVALRLQGVGRPGLSIDEELTYFACQGISEHGFPVLPSGMLYRRGVLFSYLAWISGSLFGHSLESYRYPSLVFGTLSIVLAFAFGRRASIASGFLAAALVGFAPITILVDTWARPYSMFVAVLLAAMIACRHAMEGAPGRYFVGAVVAAGLLHEYAGVLLLLPACEAFVAPERQRARRAVNLTGLAALFLGATMTAVYGVLPSPPGVASLRASAVRMGAVDWVQLPTAFLSLASPAFLAAVACTALIGFAVARRHQLPVFGALAAVGGALLHFGVVLVALLAAILGRPAKAGRFALAAITALACGTVLWLAYLKGAILPSVYISQLAASVLGYGVSYPTAAGAYLLRHYPVTMVMAGLTLGCAAWFGTGTGTQARRTGVFALCWITAFGVMVAGWAPRHRLPVLVVLFMVIALLPSVIPPSGRTTASPGGRRLLPAVLVVLLLAAVPVTWAEQQADLRWSVFAPTGSRMATFDPSPMALVRLQIRPSHAVVCNDELACLYGLGRVDYWLWPEEKFTVPADSDRIGIYGGRPVLPTIRELEPLTRHRGVVWLVVARTHKFWEPSNVDLAKLSPDIVAGLVQQSPSAVIYQLAPR